MTVNGRPVLVTGGAGFLGSHLVDLLVHDGHNVVVLDDGSRGSWSSVPQGVRRVDGDVRDAEAWAQVEALVGPVGLVHHLGAINGTARFDREATAVVDVAVNGALQAIEAARRWSARLVLCSSPEAFGHEEGAMQPGADHRFPDVRTHLRHAYGASKYIVEVLGQDAHRSGVDVRVARPCNAYGPRARAGRDGQVVAMMFERALQGRALEVHGSGHQARSFTWVGDVVRGLHLLGNLDEGVDGSGALSGAIMNFGIEEETTVLELAQRIAALTGASIQHRPEGGQPGDARRRRPDALEAQQRLGWRADVSLDEGLARTWEALQGAP